MICIKAIEPKGAVQIDRSIRVTGKGKVYVKPDTIRINIRSEGRYKEYDRTLKKARNRPAL